MNPGKIKNETDKIASGSWRQRIDPGGLRVARGTPSLAEMRNNYACFNLPDALSGKRVLDLGGWDGFYGFEAENRGALVVAADCRSPEDFFRAKETLNSQVEFRELSVYEISKNVLGSFEIVFFSGMLFDMRHPLLALEQVCEVTRDCALIESQVIGDVFPAERAVMEFDECDDFSGQFDCQWRPNIECLVRMTRSAGFPRVDILRREPAYVTIKAHRRWHDKPEKISSPLRLRNIINAVTCDHRFPLRGSKAFLMILVEGLPQWARRWETRVEVGGFGIQPIYVGLTGDQRYAGLTQINVPVPPGLEIGRNKVCVWHEGHLSNDFEIELVEGAFLCG